MFFLREQKEMTGKERKKMKKRKKFNKGEKGHQLNTQKGQNRFF